jgi:hypothetical protein
VKKKVSLILMQAVDIGVTNKREKVRIIAGSCGRKTGKNK